MAKRNHIDVPLDSKVIKTRFLASFLAYFLAIMLSVVLFFFCKDLAWYHQRYFKMFLSDAIVARFFLQPIGITLNSSYPQLLSKINSFDSRLCYATFLCWNIHFIRRIFEVTIVHNYQRYRETIDIFKVCLYYSILTFYVILSTNDFIINYYILGANNNDNGTSIGINSDINIPLETEKSNMKDLMYYFGIFLFILGECGNCYHHYLLSRLRVQEGDEEQIGIFKKRQKGHVIPKRGCFEFVTCPHYMFELISWLGMTVMTQWKSNGLILIFVMSSVILTKRAVERHNHYKQKFNGSNGMALYPRNRRAILPFLV